MLLRVSLVREGAVRAVPAAELLQHRLRKTQRPGARGRERGGASSVISNQLATATGSRGRPGGASPRPGRGRTDGGDLEKGSRGAARSPAAVGRPAPGAWRPASGWPPLAAALSDAAADRRGYGGQEVRWEWRRAEERSESGEVVASGSRSGVLLFAFLFLLFVGFGRSGIGEEWRRSDG